MKMAGARRSVEKLAVDWCLEWRLREMHEAVQIGDSSEALAIA
jgi:hypothetical protein